MKLLFKSKPSFNFWKRLVGAGVVAAAALFILVLAPVAAADLPGSYEPQNWQSSGPGTKHITSSTGATEGLTFTYNLSNAPFSLQTWNFTNTTSATANVSFNWNYHCMHSWYAAQAKLYVFADGPAGRVQVSLYSANTYGDAWGSGVYTIHVTQGYAWGFTIQGSNFDSTQLLYGDLTIDTFTVIKELTVSGISAGNKVYDGTNAVEIQVNNPTLVGVEPGDDVTLLVGVPVATFANKNAGIAKPVTISGLALGGDDASGYYLNSTITADIARLPITVTASSTIKTYDRTTSSVITPTLSRPFAIGDTASIIQMFDSKNVGTGKTLITTGTINDGNNGLNYIVTFANSTSGEIQPLPISLTAVANTKIYDGTVSSAHNPVLSAPLLVGDTGSFTQVYDNKNAGNGKLLIPSCTINDGNNGSNYDITFLSAATGEIQKLPITITAVPDSKTYDGRVLSSGVPTLSPPAISGDIPAFSQTFDNRNAGTGKQLIPSGTIADGNHGGNYEITFVINTTGVIKKLPITVVAASDRKIYDGTGFSNAAPSCFPSIAQGDSDSFTQQFADKNVGANKTIFASGRVIDGNNGDNYSYTYQNDANGQVDKLSIIVTAVPESKVYDGTTASSATPKTSQPVAAGDLWSFKQAFDTRNSGGDKLLTPFGAVIDGNNGANYDYTFISVSTGEIIKRPVSVAAVSDSKIYDGTTSSIGKPVVLTALGFGDNEFNFSQNFDNKNAGTGKTLTPNGVILDGNDGKNYNYSFDMAEGQILQKPITVTGLVAENKTFDGKTDCKINFSTATISGLTGSDVASLATSGVTGSFENGEVGASKSVAVSWLTLTGPDANNYSFIPPDLTADIIEKPGIGVASSIFGVLGIGVVFGGILMIRRRRDNG